MPLPNRKARLAEKAKARAAKAKAAPPAPTDGKPNVGPVRRKGLHLKLGFMANGGHSLEIMHAAADGADVTLRGDGIAIDEAVAKLDDAASPLVWNQIAKVGEFRGHPVGPFSLTPATFADIVRNYTEIDGGNVAFDFEHASEADESSGSIPQEGAPAQGWIRKLENRGTDGLWGLVEWLSLARGYIREGRYKFLSPAIRFGAKHPVTGQPIGARLTSVAMTNKPFLRSMQPLMASDKGSTPMLKAPLMSAAQFMPAVKAALKMHELSSATDCKDQIGKLRAMCSLADGPGSPVHGVQLGDYLTPLQALMGLGANATVEDLLDAVEEMIESAMEQHVADFHEGAPNLDDDAGGDASAEMANMADKDAAAIAANNDLAVKLGEEKARADRLTNEHASLGLRLKDAEATAVTLADKVKASEEKIALRDAEIVTLKADITKRDTDAANERVEDAFSSYKDAKKLTDDDKAAMRITLLSDKSLFDRLYPRIAPNHKHLMADLTGSRAPNGSTAPGQAPMRLPVGTPPANGGGGNSTAMMLTLSAKYKKDGMTEEEAMKRAIRETRATS